MQRNAKPQVSVLGLPFVAIAVGVFVGALTLLLGAVPSGAQSDIRIEIRPEPLHHGIPFKVNVFGLADGQSVAISYCYGEQTGRACQREGVSLRSRIPLEAKRILAVDGKVVDCATSNQPCWVELFTGGQTFRKELGFSASRPLPEVLLPSEPILAGDLINVTTNRHLGEGKQPQQQRLNDTLLQCPPRTDISSKKDCIELSTIGYDKPTLVYPHRTLLLGKKLFDCAASRGACELVLGSFQLTGTPITFEKPTTTLERQSVALSKSEGLRHYERVSLRVSTSLRTRVSASQCARRSGVKGAVCNSLNGGSLSGQASGELATYGLSVRPGRLVFSRNRAPIDCADADVSCSVVVKAEGGKHRIGNRIPITFDATETVSQPRLWLPPGPLIDGQEVDVTVTGLAPRSMKITARCVRTTPSWANCGTKQRVRADKNGVATVTITLNKVKGCATPDVPGCFLLVHTNPRTKAFRVPIVFE